MAGLPPLAIACEALLQHLEEQIPDLTYVTVDLQFELGGTSGGHISARVRKLLKQQPQEDETC
jgi:hypothetical protein